MMRSMISGMLLEWRATEMGVSMEHVDLKKGIMLGALAGIIWGWIALSVNAVTGAFQFENTLLHLLIIFAAGGAIFGIIVSGFRFGCVDGGTFRHDVGDALVVLIGTFFNGGPGVVENANHFIIIFNDGHGIAYQKATRGGSGECREAE